jgi:hypothetical protein
VATPKQGIPSKSIDHAWNGYMSHLLATYRDGIPAARALSRATRRLVGAK